METQETPRIHGRLAFGFRLLLGVYALLMSWSLTNLAFGRVGEAPGLIWEALEFASTLGVYRCRPWAVLPFRLATVLTMFGLFACLVPIHLFLREISSGGLLAIYYVSMILIGILQLAVWIGFEAHLKSTKGKVGGASARAPWDLM